MKERERTSPWVTISGEDLTKMMAEIIRLRQLSLLNEKTELPNTTALRQKVIELQREFTRKGKPNQPVVFIYGDLSKFKEINDQFGDLVGDRVLHEVGSQLASDYELRPGDFVANPHGDSFIILLLADSKKAATTVQKRIQQNIKAIKIIEKDKQEKYRTITPSIKLKHIITPISRSFDDIMRIIDKEHYEKRRSLF